LPKATTQQHIASTTSNFLNSTSALFKPYCSTSVVLKVGSNFNLFGASVRVYRTLKSNMER